MLIRCSFLLFFILSISTVAHSSNNDYLKQLRQQATDKNLWQQREWLNLLHYKDGNGNYKSRVVDDAFFNASDGKTSPESELIHTLDAFYKTSTKGDQHAQCRFIARFNWLKDKLAINPASLPEVTCADYEEWRKTNQAGSVSLIFPAYHLNSPSSMFGHTLLRLDPPENHTEWLSLAVNFGANVDNNDNSIIYAFRGLAGGYPGTFVAQPYYKKIQEYDRIEHRDIWEYKLNLTPEEIELMVTHLWELKDIKFDYYYFDENCSYRLLELLEVARPGVDLTDEFIVSAIPVDTVRAVENAHMIESFAYRPAQATEIHFELEQIPDQHRDLVKQLSEDIKTSESEAFARLPDIQQKRITDLAYKYLRYQNTAKSRDPVIARRSYQLLQKLSSYPADLDVKPSIPVPAPPEKGHNSKRLTTGAGKRLGSKYAELGLKMSFHDLEDNKTGFLRGASINIGNLQIRAVENESVMLYRLDLIDIFSLTPRTAFFDPLSWRIYTGFERQLTKGVDQLGYHVTGGSGGSWSVFGDSQFYTLATARLEANRQLDHTIEPGVGFITGLLSHFSTNTVRLEVSGEHFTDNTYRLRARYIQNFVINTNNSIKFFAKYEWQENDVVFSDINLNYQYYF
ncbi:MAG: DUF4105 domain-containing protein [Gammaproteobacteria bacterium]|nr:DUF4105 domain-containing protein [Gammaproteobacteria bacterium]